MPKTKKRREAPVKRANCSIRNYGTALSCVYLPRSATNPSMPTTAPMAATAKMINGKRLPIDHALSVCVSKLSNVSLASWEKPVRSTLAKNENVTMAPMASIRTTITALTTLVAIIAPDLSFVNDLKIFTPVYTSFW